MSKSELRSIATGFDLVFERLELLEEALTHKSFANETPVADQVRHNERLEFLGDAVLSLLVGEKLMRANPDAQEGELSQLRAALVNGEALAVHARNLDLGRWLRLGRGEERSGGRDKASLLADGFEALLGALYLSEGLDAVRELVDRLLGPEVATLIDAGPDLDAKSRLQEVLQAQGGVPPSYELRDESGPDHARIFQVAVLLDGQQIGVGTGLSKKAAEQAGAADALARLGTSDSNEPPSGEVE